MLSTNRGLLKFILLSLITFGIYALVVMTKISCEINKVASPRDGKHTMNYLLLVFIITPITFGIAQIVWWHRICNRIGDELKANNLPMEFSATTFWGWEVLGSLIIVGPFIFGHKFLKAMNTINGAYNERTFGAKPAVEPAPAPAPEPVAEEPVVEEPVAEEPAEEPAPAEETTETPAEEA